MKYAEDGSMRHTQPLLVAAVWFYLLYAYQDYKSGMAMAAYFFSYGATHLSLDSVGASD